jgi:hypothetical protein
VLVGLIPYPVASFPYEQGIWIVPWRPENSRSAVWIASQIAP